MRTVLIGNDVRFECTLKKADGTGVSLTGYDVTVSVRTDYVAPIQLDEVTVEGNVVRGRFSAGMQRMLGYYSVTVKGTMNGRSESYMADRVLRLTDGNEGLEDVEENGVTVAEDMTVLVPRDGLSAYELWLAQGNQGTMDDFIEWLSLSTEVAQKLREEFQAKDEEIEGSLTSAVTALQQSILDTETGLRKEFQAKDAEIEGSLADAVGSLQQSILDTETGLRKEFEQADEALKNELEAEIAETDADITARLANVEKGLDDKIEGLKASTVVLTQEEYDALPEKKEDVLYYILEE